jgi:hypothetical protein
VRKGSQKKVQNPIKALSEFQSPTESIWILRQSLYWSGNFCIFHSEMMVVVTIAVMAMTFTEDIAVIVTQD